MSKPPPDIDPDRLTRCVDAVLDAVGVGMANGLLPDAVLGSVHSALMPMFNEYEIQEAVKMVRRMDAVPKRRAHKQ